MRFGIMGSMRSGAGISASGIAARAALIALLAGILLAAFLKPGEAGASTGGGIVSHKLDSTCLLYTSPSPRDGLLSRMPSSA